MLRREQSGQVLVLGALCMVALMGFAGLGVDLGLVRYEQQRLQTVADSAALGGATQLRYSAVTTGATNAAALDDFVSGSNDDTLTINNPPASGPHSGDVAYVEVIAGHTTSTSFMSWFGFPTLALTERAVAFLANGPSCVYALDPTASGAITANGSFNVNVQCGITVDSSNPQAALTVNGSGTISAKYIGINGGVRENGSVTLNPTPVTGAVPASDPLGYLNPPSTSGSCSPTTTINGTGTFTLSPGIYCSTLIINGSPTVNLSPGVYVLDSGAIMNGSPTLIGSGVTFYNASGGMTLNGSNTTNLSAPTTGDYAGILVFQNRTDSSSFTLNGSNSATLNGAIYVPDARIVDNGSGSVGSYSILIGDTLTINGSGSIHDNYSTLSGGSPIKAAVLVE